ncbi:MAG: disulfide bond formation protein DsbD [Bacteroidetes bacterium 4572_77]|nr:MAG: disulfide bond formation protein DsbD [Bacteroidetes bacterium 4572_77]
MKKFLLFTAIMLTFLGVNTKVQAEILIPVKWQVAAQKVSDNEVVITYKALIDEHWHLYSQDIIDPDGNIMAPPATTFFFEKNDGFELLGAVEEMKSIEEFDPNFNMILKYFAKETTFTARFKLLTTEQVIIKGYVNYMSCDDTRCLPPADEDFEFVFNEDKTSVIEANESINDLTGEGEKSLWGFFLVSFLFGLAGILTPCVFPMIPMTVSFFMKGGENKAKGRMEATIYGISIVVIYVFIGSVLAVVAGPDIANFLSTHWLPNLLFFGIFIIFAASFFGMFEIVLPHWLVNKSTANEDKGGFVGPIFMALTLVLVSFSCTGPIVGTILVESAGGQFLKPIIGMLGFSLAFALPFTGFAFFPQYLDKLPKSGGWLNSVKVVLGFLELALGLKFLSIADQTYHWGLLDREIYIALWIVIFTLMGIYLLGKIKFAHDSDTPYLSVPRLFMAIATFSFVVYMIPGMWGAPLKALSGYMPPMHTHDFDMNKMIRDNVGIAGVGGDEASSICEEPKYAEFLHLPHGLKGYFDYEQALACAKEQNKPVFVDFTGHGCVNCREMEANVWADPEVIKMLKNDFIVTALYVDDKQSLPEEEWYTSTYDNKVKKSIGKKFADLQITKYNMNAQPYYVLLNPNGEMLVQPRAYDLNVNKFVDFLKRGQENFENGKSVK